MTRFYETVRLGLLVVSLSAAIYGTLTFARSAGPSDDYGLVR